ncbi:class I SAM-dependent methyltransferase [Vibrio sp. ZSDE26]|uniref:Class I SAM-dependent methyltransferase n=1 Tax=Vibrio amylolyticus TaxID=2847292 RepID=A0A9X2BFE4_9VIBR|nr:class I SAM-dependent methyltransferase [Vibrio amylolyticus]MCK6261741.1 class I SAM-dependent methyltransferase [Vibrio amylolyticus]
MSEMYIKHADKYAKVVKDNIYNACLERPSTLALLDDVTDKNVVDMGCGTGIYAKWFIEHSVKQLTCVDLSSEMVDIVNREFGSAVKSYAQDVSLGLPAEQDNSADIIICPLVLHYVEDLKPVFNDVQRVLKKGGYMVFSTHHPFADFECTTSGNYFERETVQEEWDTIGTPVSVRFYRRSLSEIINAVTASGLVVSKLSEGDVDEKAKDICESTYIRLKNNPNFLFVRCERI